MRCVLAFLLTVLNSFFFGVPAQPSHRITNEVSAEFNDIEIIVRPQVEYLKHIIRHEFSHPFINPLTDKYRDHIKDYSANFESIPAIARKNVCGDWQECVNEFTIRAITTCLALAESPESGNAAYKREESRGKLSRCVD